MMQNIIFSKKIHLPKFKKRSKTTKKTTEILATLNNLPYWYRYSKTQIKEEYKTLLKEFYIPEPTKQYTSLIIEYRIIRHIRTKIDKDNVVFALKWISDSLEDLGYIKNDTVVNFHSYDTVYDISLPETMLEIRISDNTNIW